MINASDRELLLRSLRDLITEIETDIPISSAEVNFKKEMPRSMMSDFCKAKVMKISNEGSVSHMDGVVVSINVVFGGVSNGN